MLTFWKLYHNFILNPLCWEYKSKKAAQQFGENIKLYHGFVTDCATTVPLNLAVFIFVCVLQFVWIFGFGAHFLNVCPFYFCMHFIVKNHHNHNNNINSLLPTTCLTLFHSYVLENNRERIFTTTIVRDELMHTLISESRLSSSHRGMWFLQLIIELWIQISQDVSSQSCLCQTPQQLFSEPFCRQKN